MKNKNIIIIILILLVLALTGYIVYDKVLKNSDTNTDSNIDNTSNPVVAIEDLIGTYHNSDYNDIYFRLNSDGTADVVSSSCSEGPLPLSKGTYKTSKKNDVVVLEIIDGNGNSSEYHGTLDENGNYQFKPLIFDCVEDDNTYYIKK